MLYIEKSHHLLVLSGRLLNGCRTGQSKITRGYDLPAFVSRFSLLFMIFWYWSVLYRRHIIHTVGPVYNLTSKSNSEEKAEKAEQLGSAYRTSLALALENSIRHIVSYMLFFSLGVLPTLHQAFPSISTGVYSYPVPAAARIALNEVRTVLESEHGNEVSTSILFFFSSSDLKNLKKVRENHICGLE